jgi:hypothetical protein
MAVDLDDTTQCPTAERCESCDAATDLAVVTLDTPIGVYCLTACGTCVTEARFPTGWATTAALVLRHCGHLDIDLDQMADLRAGEFGADEGGA